MIDNKLVGGGRLAYLDALKCLGILLVISGHVQFFGMDIKDSYACPSFLMIYSFNMPLFFFVSGYLAFKDNAIGKIGELKKLKNKFLFLVLPAVVFYIFFSFSQYGSGGLFDFFLSGFGKYWFTFTLFEMFVLFYLVNGISRTKSMLSMILAILSIIGVGYLGLFSQYDIAFFDFNRLSKYFQFFSLGVFAKMFAERYDKLMRNECLKAIALIGFFGLLYSLYQVNMPGAFFHFLRDIVLRYLGVYVVVSFFYCNQEVFNSNSRLNNLILKIGQNSLAIYLLQYFFMPDFSAFPEWLSGLDTLSTFAINFTYTIFITALCMVFIELLSNSVFVRRYVLGKVEYRKRK